MDGTKIIELASYTLPALITGGVAYFLFHSFFKNEENRRRFELLKENQKQALPIRLQAYERIVLLLERINPTQLLLRVSPISNDKNDYATLLIHTIQTEFEHNLTQQVYLTSATWDIINKAKNSTIQLIRQTSIEEDVLNAEKLREAILISLTENEAPSAIAISYLKEELKTVF
ncbi:hypothetical protein SY27_03480 [Flavobacterium sp. 316]|uniref:Uncharacterized protein n=1 Tax=Flavobacterium sediminilitoris TaxID=2024526 RepID=A0ABY4HLM6_9FLAO|nr:MULTISPECIES: hypothetical protein [Flavobacterium]KIX22884.1 hypothetical protein SY27_03480 [Flavobacterium sp. 316]UOX33196.1 hypothetical protein LXD69_14260 [Flavobacterium sediminilitoris]